MAVRVIVTVYSSRPDSIWNVLAKRLGREPTPAEAAAECRRILRGDPA